MGRIEGVELNIEGASNTRYKFDVYTLDTEFQNIGAVYVFTKRTTKVDGTASHAYIYFGETGTLGDRISTHEKWPCVRENDGNCICVHLDNDERTRRDKETDLLRAHDTPCND